MKIKITIGVCLRSARALLLDSGTYAVIDLRCFKVQV